MTIRYIEPLSRAVDRAVQICFRPFDLGKWFVLGFACWLARLVQGGGGGGGWSVPTPPLGDREAEGAINPKEWIESLEPEMFLGGAALFVVLGCMAVFFFVILPLLLWISSRGEFMFLDNVVHDKAEIKAPWYEYRTEGNSLFLWRVGFIVTVIVVAALAAVPLILYAVRVGEDLPSILLLLLLVCPLFLIVVGAVYVDLFLRSFVVPIMYRDRLKTNAAWSRFAPALKARLGWFLLYGLWLLVLMIGVMFGILILVLVTCCIAGCLLAIPYIGTVLLLPLWVGLRALSLEFLAQFGDEFKIFPDPEPALATAAAGPAPPAPPPPAPPSAEPPPAGFEPEV
jgi:hypothetical protein